MKSLVIAGIVTTLAAGTVASQERLSPTDALIARAKSFEFDTPYVPPPGDPLEHHTSGFAKIMCSAVFMTGLSPEFAAGNVGYFTSPYRERAKVGKPVIDRVNQAVNITMPNGVVRTAKYLGSQGCVTLPIGKTTVNFTPVLVKSAVPDASTLPWPMGDVVPTQPLPKEIDEAKLKQAINAAFEPADSLTAAFVVTWRGRLIAERYGEGINERTPLEGWSMGKSLTATLMGVLIKQGVYDLWQPAPVPEWRSGNDPRAKIRIADILLIGIRTVVIETDPFGNFLGQGYELGSGRDWARLGNLYLQDGVWNGERILPEGYVKFVSTLAPAWEADKRPIYGGFFWINGTGTFPVPREAYYMSGAGGQTTLIIPSHDLVVVRMGHFKGEGPGGASFRKALSLLMEAVPAKR